MLFCYCCLVVFAVLEMELGNLLRLDKCSTTELQCQPSESVLCQSIRLPPPCVHPVPCSLMFTPLYASVPGVEGTQIIFGLVLFVMLEMKARSFCMGSTCFVSS